MRDSSSLIAIVLTAVFGFGYPAVMTGFAQVAFSNKANGSLIKRNGRSSAPARRPGFTTPQYFHERPSATAPAYNAGATTFANLGPDQPRPGEERQGRGAPRSSKLEGPYNPGLTIRDIPVDAVTTSALRDRPGHLAGLCGLQSRRVAAVRHLPLATVQKLI